MNGSWKVNKFADAPVAIIDGDRGKNYPKQDEFSEDGYCLFLNANSVTREGFLFQTVQFITKEKDEILRSGKLNRNDVVMTTRGTIGNVAYFNKKIPFEHLRINSGMVIFRCEREKILPAFLFQYLRSPVFRSQINAMKSGVAQPQLPICDIKQMTIPIPSILEQGKISSLLFVYDDLIENNNRRIKILEEMVQTTYDEWFVKYRFPGYSKVKMVESELGDIPEGWKIARTEDIFTIVLGGTPSRSKPEYWDGGNVPWVNSGKVNELRIIDASEYITELGLNSSSTKMMPARTTVLAITGATLGQVSLLEIEVCANQSVVGIYDNQSLYNEYIYLKFCEIIQQVIKKAGGGAQQHINKEIVNETRILIPPRNVMDSFNDIIRPVFDLITNLLKKNKSLGANREILLPKLISGEMNVEDLDIKTEDIE
jgi:type I restriction enzyme, S subunit